MRYDYIYNAKCADGSMYGIGRNNGVWADLIKVNLANGAIESTEQIPNLASGQFTGNLQSASSYGQYFVLVKDDNNDFVVAKSIAVGKSQLSSL